MSNEQTSTSSQVFYDGTYKTALSNYIITVTGGGQILVSDVNNWNKFVGIKPPTDSDAYANTRQLMLVYTKPTSGNVFDTANYSWISTDAGMIKFQRAWQLLTATSEGNFEYINPPTTNEIYYLYYDPAGGIKWTTVVNNLPFTPNVKSQIIGYDVGNQQAINIIGTRANYVLQTTNANNTGLQFGYISPANLNLNYQTIDGYSAVIAKSNNTFELSHFYKFSQNLQDGEIIYLDKSDPNEPFLNGIDVTSNQYMMLYTIENDAGFMRWKYDYFNQAVAGLGNETTETEGKLAMWENGRLIAKSVEDIMGEIDNYYQWSSILTSSAYFCQEGETIENNIYNYTYTHTITLANTLGNVVKNRFFSYGGNLEFNYNIVLHCDNLRDYFIDDTNLDGINISMNLSQCDSSGNFIENGITRTLSICNVPLISVATPIFKLQDNIIVPFQFDDIPVDEQTQKYMFLPVSLNISTINDTSLDIAYNSLQSKYKFRLATKNMRQSFKCKKLYVFKNKT